jgi:hypothetical protein
LITIILAIATFWLALSIAAGLLFARVATLHKRREALAVKVVPDPQVQLVPAPPLGQKHVA